MLGVVVHSDSAGGSEPPRGFQEHSRGGAGTLFRDQTPEKKPVGAASQEKVRATPDSSPDPNRLAHTKDAVRCRLVILPPGRRDEGSGSRRPGATCKLEQP